MASKLTECTCCGAGTAGSDSTVCQECKQPLLVRTEMAAPRPLLEDSPRNWPEDYQDGENKYHCVCVTCDYGRCH